MRWMLEHGTAEARVFLPQLERATVTPFRCPCGSASIDFGIEGYPASAVGTRPVADFVFGEGDNVSGIFVFVRRGGVLGGVEVYAGSGEAPKVLPAPEELRPFSSQTPA